MGKVAIDERTSMEELGVEECMVLLRWEVIGRLAVAAPGRAPSVVPVNFVLHDGTIIFLSDGGEKLTLLADQPVSFQCDRFDWYRRLGWSVLVRGIAHEIDLATVEDLELQPWAPGRKGHAVQIVPSAITGRRIRLDVSALDGRAYL